MATSDKSLLYSRQEAKKQEQEPQIGNLEGLSFTQGPQSRPSEPTLEGRKFSFASGGDYQPQADAERKVDEDEEEEEEEEDSSSGEEIDENTDIFSPEFVRSRVVNMPELIELIKDPTVLEHLNNPKVTEYLREISLDPNNKIPELCDTQEIGFLKKKMEDLIKKTYPEAQVPVRFEKPPPKT